MKRGICNLENGAEHVLTLSDCHPDKFTCDSGHCIQLNQKCDSIVDCLEDGSDENNCEFLLKGPQQEDYTKDKLPLQAEDNGDIMKVRSDL